MIQLLEYITNTLESLELPYMLSGSIAMNTYTTPRMTRDIDIIIHLESQDVDKFVAAFEQDFYCYKPGIVEEVARRGMFNLIDNRTSYKVDFIVRKDSEYRIEEFSRKQRTNVFGFDTYVVSLEDLIISKFIWIQVLQSDQQKEDIRNLLESEKINTEYLIYWIKKLNLQTFNLLSL
ncbi:MAG: DUF6036 family nucleotidyltransferase [Bernardetiaceae bacterium]